jgi:hypothetical protein
MTILVLCFTTRKPTLSFTDYKTYYETIHSRNIYTLFGPHSPSTYSRHYVSRSSDGTSDHIPSTGSPITFLTGRALDFPYDCVTVMTWDSEEAYVAMTEKFQDPEVARRFAEDEERFLDRSKTVLMSLGEVPVRVPEARAL